jgi:hypothetical protein
MRQGKFVFIDFGGAKGRFAQVKTPLRVEQETLAWRIG